MKLSTNKFALDPSKTNWFNLLPPLRNKRIICYGSIDHSIIEALIQGNCKCDVLKEWHPKHKDYASVRYIEENASLPEREYDLCIVNWYEFIKNRKIKNVEKINGFYRALKNDGVIVVWSNNRTLEIITVFLIKHLLIKIGFKHIEAYLCNPSFEKPLTLYPLAGDYKTRCHVYKNVYGRVKFNNKLKPYLKNVVRYFFHQFSGPCNPFCGALYKGVKSEKTYHFDLTDSNENASPWEQPLSRSSITIWTATPFCCKQIGMVYRADDNMLAYVLKKTNVFYHNDFKIEKEFKKLKILNKQTDIFSQNKVELPCPFFLKKEHNRIITVESPVRGIPLSEININAKNQYVEYLTHLKQLVNIQKNLQCNVAEGSKDGMNFLEDYYFENSLNLDFAYFDDIDRTNDYQPYFQHGDYVDKNIFYDYSTGVYGIIDWEWAAFGFPLLFDIFYLFLSAWYRKKGRQEENYLDHCHMSFVETFFEESMFGDYIQELIDEYCSNLSINRNLVFEYFCDFLLLNYNKHRVNYKTTLYEDFFKRNLTYALSNKDKFVFF